MDANEMAKKDALEVGRLFAGASFDRMREQARSIALVDAEAAKLIVKYCDASERVKAYFQSRK